MHSASEATQTVTTEYNGWSNRETWLVNLWLSNDMGSYEFLQSICKNHCETWEKVEELEALDAVFQSARLSSGLVSSYRGEYRVAPTRPR